MLIFILASLGYLTLTGMVFKIVGDTTDDPDRPWDTPGPFAAGLFWPVFIAVTLGALIAGRFTPVSKENRIHQQRLKEIADAKHKVNLARIEAEETSILERSLRK